MQDAFEVPLAAHRVAIHAGNARLGKIAMQLLLHFFRTGPDEIQILTAAFRTNRRDLLRVIAVVAKHAAVAAVISQRDGAVDAFQPFAARPARDETRKAATVKQQHGLLMARPALREGLRAAPAAWS